MNSFTNGDLYLMLLDRLRKDRRGSVSPEEFESFLRWRNIDYFNKMISMEGENKMNENALMPFYIPFSPLTIAQDTQTLLYYADITSITTYGQYINVWHTTAIVNPTRPALTGIVPVDIVTNTELPDRLRNAITGPSATNPIGYFVNGTAGHRLYVHGISSTTGTIVMSYYRIPEDPYFDYYSDSQGNTTYLVETSPATTHVLLSGEVSRDGKTTGQTVTSASVDLDWGDDDAVNILDMIVSDVSIAMSDPNSFQASLLERKENA